MLYSSLIFTNLVSKENAEIFFALSIQRFTYSLAHFILKFGQFSKRDTFHEVVNMRTTVVVSDGDEKSHGKTVVGGK